MGRRKKNGFDGRRKEAGRGAARLSFLPPP